MGGLWESILDPIACDEAMGYEKMTQGNYQQKNPKTKIFLACHKNLAIFKYELNLYQIDLFENGHIFVTS